MYNKLTDINVNEYNYLPKRRLIGKMVYDNNCVGKLINKFDNNEDIYVSELSVDDLTYIGYNTNLEYISYLNNDYFVNKNKDFWLLSLSSYKDGIVYEYKLSNNILTENNINESANYRPVITLIKNVSHIKGDGTKTNPYYIK